MRKRNKVLTAATALKNYVTLWIFLLCGVIALVSQDPSRYGHPPDRRVESQQGQPGEGDVIGHKRVEKGTHLDCIDVEHYPKHGRDDGAACLVKFEDGDQHTLPLGQSMVVPKDGEFRLECLGDKPTRCAVGVWQDSGR